MARRDDLDRLAAGVVMIGFHGSAAPPETLALLRRGAAGAIFFARNLGTPAEIFGLGETLRKSVEHPILLAVDQEGGRVARLRSGFTALPTARQVGTAPDALTAASLLGTILGQECRAAGFDIDFAPVLDVDTNPDNPVIGDRSFGGDPQRCAELGASELTALQAQGVAACGKHFPGHGDTLQDSHLDLPRLSHDWERLRSVELVPFRAAARAGVASLMTAHVVFEALDLSLPATLSELSLPALRAEIGFGGVLVSDDLEMAAIADRFEVGEAATRAVGAGCDLLLVCHRADRQAEAIESLAHWAGQSSQRRERLTQAVARVEALKRSYARPAGQPFRFEDLRRPAAVAFERRFAPTAGDDPTARAITLL